MSADSPAVPSPAPAEASPQTQTHPLLPSQPPPPLLPPPGLVPAPPAGVLAPPAVLLTPPQALPPAPPPPPAMPAAPADADVAAATAVAAENVAAAIAAAAAAAAPPPELSAAVFDDAGDSSAQPSEQLSAASHGGGGGGGGGGGSGSVEADAYLEDGKVYLNGQCIGTVDPSGHLIGLDGTVIGAVDESVAQSAAAAAAVAATAAAEPSNAAAAPAIAAAPVPAASPRDSTSSGIGGVPFVVTAQDPSGAGIAVAGLPPPRTAVASAASTADASAGIAPGLLVPPGVGMGVGGNPNPNANPNPNPNALAFPSLSVSIPSNGTLRIGNSHGHGHGHGHGGHGDAPGIEMVDAGARSRAGTATATATAGAAVTRDDLLSAVLGNTPVAGAAPNPFAAAANPKPVTAAAAAAAAQNDPLRDGFNDLDRLRRLFLALKYLCLERRIESTILNADTLADDASLSNPASPRAPAHATTHRRHRHRAHHASTAAQSAATPHPTTGAAPFGRDKKHRPAPIATGAGAGAGAGGASAGTSTAATPTAAAAAAAAAAGTDEKKPAAKKRNPLLSALKRAKDRDAKQQQQRDGGGGSEQLLKESGSLTPMATTTPRAAAHAHGTMRVGFGTLLVPDTPKQTRALSYLVRGISMRTGGSGVLHGGALNRAAAAAATGAGAGAAASAAAGPQSDAKAKPRISNRVPLVVVTTSAAAATAAPSSAAAATQAPPQLTPSAIPRTIAAPAHDPAAAAAAAVAGAGTGAGGAALHVSPSSSALSSPPDPLTPASGAPDAVPATAAPASPAPATVLRPALILAPGAPLPGPTVGPNGTRHARAPSAGALGPEIALEDVESPPPPTDAEYDAAVAARARSLSAAAGPAGVPATSSGAAVAAAAQPHAAAGAADEKHAQQQQHLLLPPGADGAPAASTTAAAGAAAAAEQEREHDGSSASEAPAAALGKPEAMRAWARRASAFAQRQANASAASEAELYRKKASAILNMREAKYRAFADADMEQHELTAFRRVHAALGGEYPQLSVLEKRLYRDLMQLLQRTRANARLFSFTDARYGVGKFGDFEATTIRRMYVLIKYLRQIETNPRSWHDTGFLNRIDNELAVLLYRRPFRATPQALALAAQTASDPALAPSLLLPIDDATPKAADNNSKAAPAALVARGPCGCCPPACWCCACCRPRRLSGVVGDGRGGSGVVSDGDGDGDGDDDAAKAARFGVDLHTRTCQCSAATTRLVLSFVTMLFMGVGTLLLWFVWRGVADASTTSAVERLALASDARARGLVDAFLSVSGPWNALLAFAYTAQPLLFGTGSGSGSGSGSGGWTTAAANASALDAYFVDALRVSTTESMQIRAMYLVDASGAASAGGGVAQPALVGAYRALSNDSHIGVVTNVVAGSSGGSGCLRRLSVDPVTRQRLTPDTALVDPATATASPQCPYDIVSQSWFTGGVNGSSSGVGTPARFDDAPALPATPGAVRDDQAVTFYTPLRNGTGHVVALACADVQLAQLSNALYDIDVADTGFVLLLDAATGVPLAASTRTSSAALGANDAAADPHRALLLQVAAGVSALYPTVSAVASSALRDGQSHGVTVAGVRAEVGVSSARAAGLGVDWLLVTVQPRADHDTPNNAISIALVVVSFVAACLLMVTSYWTVQRAEQADLAPAPPPMSRATSPAVPAGARASINLSSQQPLKPDSPSAGSGAGSPIAGAAGAGDPPRSPALLSPSSVGMSFEQQLPSPQHAAAASSPVAAASLSRQGSVEPGATVAAAMGSAGSSLTSEGSGGAAAAPPKAAVGAGSMWGKLKGAIADVAQREKEQRRKAKQISLVLGGVFSVLTIGAIVAMYGVWALSTEASVDTLARNVMRQQHRAAVDAVADTVTTAAVLNALNTARLAPAILAAALAPTVASLSALFANATHSTVPGGLDRHFSQVLAASADRRGRFPFSAVYVSLEQSDEFVGAAVLTTADGTPCLPLVSSNPSNPLPLAPNDAVCANANATATAGRSPFLVVAKDADSGGCYYRYHAARDGRRDTTAPFWLRDCEWDRRDTTWYQRVASSSVSGGSGSGATAGTAFGYGDSVVARPSFTGLYPLDYSSGDGRRESVTGGGATSPLLDDGGGAVQYVTMGVTAVYPVYNATGALVAVFGVDVNAAYFSSQLYSAQQALTEQSGGPATTIAGQTRFFVSDSRSQLVASSTREHAAVVYGSVVPMQGAASSDRVVASTAAFLGNSSADVLSSNASQVFRRLNDPLTAVQSIRVLDLQWVSVATTSLDANVRIARSFSDLLFLVILIAIVYLGVASFRTYHGGVFDVDDDDDRDADAARAQLGGVTAKRRHLEQILRTIRPTILSAANKTYLESATARRKEPWDFIEFADVQQHYQRAAVEHVRDCARQLNILTLSTLREQGSRVALFFYHVHAHTLYAVFMFAVVLAHVLLMFWEPATVADLRDRGPALWLLVTEAVFLVIELVDTVTKHFLLYHWGVRNLLTPKYEWALISLRLLVWAVVVVDWLLTLFVSYSFEYYVPVRLLLVLLRVDSVREACHNLIAATMDAWNIIVFFLTLVVVSATFAIVLFRSDLVPDKSAIPNLPYGAAAHFGDFYESAMYLFIFVATADNFTEMVFPTVMYSAWGLLFWLPLVVLGMFFVLGTAINSFENSFSESRAKAREKRLMFSRTGSISAFALLDLNMQQCITRAEFERFLYALVPHFRERNTAVRNLWLAMHKTKAEDTIDVSDFCRGLEDLSVTTRTYSASGRPAPWRLTLQDVYEQDWVQTAVMGVVVFQLWCSCLRGTLTDEFPLDVVMCLAAAFFFAEITLKIIAYGPGKYWNYAHYFLDTDEHEGVGYGQLSPTSARRKQQQQQQRMSQQSSRPSTAGSVGSAGSRGPSPPPGSTTLRRFSQVMQSIPVPSQLKALHAKAKAESVMQMFEHRFESVLVYGAAVGLLVLVCVTGLEYPDRIRALMTLPVLRVFTFFAVIRRLTYLFYSSVPDLAPMFVFMALVFFAYAVIGVQLWTGKFSILQADAPPSTYDNLGAALLSLFQVFTQQGWGDVMFASVNVSSFSAAWYAASFFLISTLLVGSSFKAYFTGLDPNFV